MSPSLRDARSLLLYCTISTCSQTWFYASTVCCDFNAEAQTLSSVLEGVEALTTLILK